MTRTERTLRELTEAIAEYALHLKSHTAAIQGLSEASQELKRSAAEQNRILADLANAITQTPSAKEPAITGEQEPSSLPAITASGSLPVRRHWLRSNGSCWRREGPVRDRFVLADRLTKTLSGHHPGHLGIDGNYHRLFSVVRIEKDNRYFPLRNHLCRRYIAGYGNLLQIDLVAAGKLYGSLIATGVEAL
jgi:hypothetical protein